MVSIVFHYSNNILDKKKYVKGSINRYDDTNK